MSMIYRKKRVPNFSPSETELLIRLVRKYFHIIENKKTDAATNALKDETWCKLAQDFNRVSKLHERCSKVLRRKYVGMKKKRKLFIGHRRNLCDTVGPPPDVHIVKVEPVTEMGDHSLEGSPAPHEPDTMANHDKSSLMTIEIEHSSHSCDIDHDYKKMNNDTKVNGVDDSSDVNKTSSQFPLQWNRRKCHRHSSETLINTVDCCVDLSNKKKELIEAQLRSIDAKMKQDAKEHELKCELMLLEIMLKKRELQL